MLIIIYRFEIVNNTIFNIQNTPKMFIYTIIKVKAVLTISQEWLKTCNTNASITIQLACTYGGYVNSKT